MNMPVPTLYTQVKENKFVAFMLIWLVGNMVQGSLLSTGAFEIYKGDRLIWSSLQESRLPNMGDIVQAFDSVGVQFMEAQAPESGA